jgi:hypothetical protein
MAELATYYNPDTGNPHCEACGSKSWETCNNCPDCEAEVCSECGIYAGDDLLCRTRAAIRQAEAQLEETIDSAQTLWDVYQENWVEMTEFRIPPKRAEHLQLVLDFDGEVA